MTPDQLCKAIFKHFNTLCPDDDHGDLTITVQDDSAVVSVSNGDYTVYSNSIQGGLEEWYYTMDQL